MNTKIIIEALAPAGYTNERLAELVRQHLAEFHFRVFKVDVKQTPAEHGLEQRRAELKANTKAAAESAAAQEKSSTSETTTGGGKAEGN